MKKIVFDVDDTLYNLADPFITAYQEVFDNRFDIPLAELFIAYRKHGDVVFEDSQSGKISMDEMHIYRIGNAIKDFGISITDEEALTFQAKYRLEQKNIRLSEDIEKLLSDLKESGIKIGILTNGPSDHQRNKIYSLSLLRFVDEENIIVSGDYEFSKPDIRIFRVAEQKMCLEKETIWYVGDSYTSDVIGAKQAGWNCIWYNRRNQIQPDCLLKPDFVASDEESLIGLIRRLFS